MRVAVVSNLNMDPIKRFFDDCYIAPFGQYWKELKDRSSVIWTEKFDVVWFHFDIEFEEEDYIHIVGEELLQDIENYTCKNRDRLVLFSELLTPYYFYEHFFRKSRLVIDIDEVNCKVRELVFKCSNFLSLPTDFIRGKVGKDKFRNETFWYAGRMKYSLDAFEEFSKEVKRIYKAYRGNSKKVLILDLDNTLWGGVVGEDGIGGIELSEDGKGKVYRDFQKSIKQLMKLGILLCIVSKNNYSDVENVFKRHPAMVLKLDDFIVKKIDWKPKHENIKEIAEELNLGLDSFVFIDDSPFERKIVRDFLPEVVVPEFPDDITHLNSWFWEEVVYEYFPKIDVTEEDKSKVEQYRRNIKRKELQENVSSYEEFLKSLNIRVKIYVDDGRFRTRLAQLTQKTNQFNLTTRRYTESDIENFLNSKDVVVYALEYQDIFGSEGIVGEAIVRLRGKEAYIDTFLMSCRVIGRNVEYKFMDFILKDLFKRGVNIVHAEYIPTAKNGIVRDFYVRAGFEKIGEHKFVKEIGNGFYKEQSA